MKLRWKILPVVLSVLVAFSAYGDDNYDEGGASYWGARNETPAFRLKSKVGESTTVNIYSNGTGNMVIKSSGITNSVDINVATNINGLVGDLIALTNASGRLLFEVDGDCALAADLVAGNLIEVTNTFQSGSWATFYFDSLSNSTYGVYLPGKDVGGPSDGRVVRKLHYDLGGTGDVTFAFYQERVLKWQKTVTSPYYVAPATAAGTVTTNSAINQVTGSVIIDMPVYRGDNCFFRATRGTGADAPGGMGATVEYTY